MHNKRINNLSRAVQRLGSKMNHQQAQKCAANRVESEPVSGSKPAFPPAQKCATTNTYTNTETNKGTAADLPMPAGGQASRLLEQKRGAESSRRFEILVARYVMMRPKGFLLPRFRHNGPAWGSGHSRSRPS